MGDTKLLSNLTPGLPSLLSVDCCVYYQAVLCYFINLRYTFACYFRGTLEVARYTHLASAAEAQSHCDLALGEAFFVPPVV